MPEISYFTNNIFLKYITVYIPAGNFRTNLIFLQVTFNQRITPGNT